MVTTTHTVIKRETNTNATSKTEVLSITKTKTETRQPKPSASSVVTRSMNKPETFSKATDTETASTRVKYLKRKVDIASEGRSKRARSIDPGLEEGPSHVRPNKPRTQTRGGEKQATTNQKKEAKNDKNPLEVVKKRTHRSRTVKGKKYIIN